MRKHSRLQSVIFASMTAVLYAVFTLIFWEFSSLGIQFRISEALTVLSACSFFAVPGLTIGCFLSNLLSGNLFDAIFGSIATFIGAATTYLFRNHLQGKKQFLVPLPTVLANTLIMPFVFFYGYGQQAFLGYETPLPVLLLFALSVFIGETTICYLLGLPFLRIYQKHILPKFQKDTRL